MSRTDSPDFGRQLNRALTSLVVLVLLSVLGFSALLALGDRLIVGESEAGPPIEDRQLVRLPGAIPPEDWVDGRPGEPVVALTFDDGPDPEETPELLDVLAAHNVQATFFITGRQVTAEPEIVKRIVDEGHELGLHSYNHSRMGNLSASEVLRQYQLNQRVVTGHTGVKPVIARPPYSGGVQFQTDRELWAARIAQEQGGLTMIFSEIMPRDFDGLSAAEIAAQSRPDDGASAIITLHDGAGPRPLQTAEAMDLLIPELKDEGYQFVTASEYGGVDGVASVTAGERVLNFFVAQSAGLFGTLRDWLRLLTWVVAPLFLLRSVGLVALAWIQARRRRPAGGGFAPGVTVIVPAYNEEVGIVDALDSFLRQDYDGPLEIMVVDDGSSDDTVKEALGVRQVRVLSKPNGGKASALNAGIRAATHDFCVLVDGDTVFESTTVSDLVQPFTDPKVGAVAGYPKVGNWSTNLLTQVQNVEYIVGCTLLRQAQEGIAAISCMPGAVAAFRKSALDEVGGVPEATMAEDTDLTVALGSAGWRLSYVPNAVAWTEAPIDLLTFWKQRIRWTYGVFQVMWRHRFASAESENGNGYRRKVLAITLTDLILLPLTPLTDIFALLAIITGQVGPLVWAVGLTILVHLITTAVAVGLERERPRVLLYAPLQLLFFRYFTLMVTLTAMSSALTGRREKWNKPKRVGLNTGPKANSDKVVQKVATKQLVAASND